MQKKMQSKFSLNFTLANFIIQACAGELNRLPLQNMHGKLIQPQFSFKFRYLNLVFRRWTPYIQAWAAVTPLMSTASKKCPEREHLCATCSCLISSHSPLYLHTEGRTDKPKLRTLSGLCWNVLGKPAQMVTAYSPFLGTAHQSS